MTDVERAFEYLRIFIGAGEAWRNFVPVDADLVTKDSVRIGTAEVGPGENGRWWLKDLALGTIKWFAPAVSS
jgi:hypothetical protein